MSARIKRKFMAHYIDASLTATPAYVRLGKDLEEYTVEMGANVDTKKNILGETRTLIDGYEKSASVEPYHAEVGDALFVRLQKIIDEEQTLDDLDTTVLEVHLWDEVSANTYVAYRESAVIEVSSYGGDQTGYQIPFNVHHTSNRVKGTFNVSTRVFTPDAGELGVLVIELAAATASATKVTDVIGESVTANLKYKLGGGTLAKPAYGDSDSGYTALTIGSNITVSAGQSRIVVVEASSGIIVKSSEAENVKLGT